MDKKVNTKKSPHRETDAVNNHTRAGVCECGNANLRDVVACSGAKTCKPGRARIKIGVRDQQKRNKSSNTTCLGYDSQQVREFDNTLITQRLKGRAFELIRIDEIMN